MLDFVISYYYTKCQQFNQFLRKLTWLTHFRILQRSKNINDVEGIKS